MGSAHREHCGLAGLRCHLDVATHPFRSVLLLPFVFYSGSSMFQSSLVDVPRPFIDSISTLVEALGIASLTIPRPRTSGTIAVATDAHLRGIAMLHLPELAMHSVHEVVARCSHIAGVHAVVVVSVRTSSPVQPFDTELLQYLTQVLSHAGIALRDWVVVGQGGLYCPRSLLGLADPWPATSLHL